MKLLYGVLVMVVAADLYFLLLVSVRNPNPSRWKGETLIDNVYLPFLVFMGVVGLALVVKYLMAPEPLVQLWKPLGFAVVLVIIGGVLAKRLYNRACVQHYDQLSKPRKPADIVDLPSDERKDPSALKRAA